MRIQLGANLRRIRESNDVYFECEVQSNPRLNEQIQWWFLREPASLSSSRGQSLSSGPLTSAGNIVNSISTNLANTSSRNASIERIFSKHVPSQSRASHSTSLLFLDSTSADSWISKQLSSKSGPYDEDWLSLSVNQITSSTSTKNYDQIDLKHFQLVTGGTNVIVADSSLVLQKVQRTQRGLYTCSAANSRGRTFSKPIFLDVNCKY